MKQRGKPPSLSLLANCLEEADQHHLVPMSCHPSSKTEDPRVKQLVPSFSFLCFIIAAGQYNAYIPFFSDSILKSERAHVYAEVVAYG